MNPARAAEEEASEDAICADAASENKLNVDSKSRPRNRQYWSVRMPRDRCDSCGRIRVYGFRVWG